MLILTVFSSNTCPYCTDAKEVLTQHHLTFQEIDVNQPGRREQLQRMIGADKKLTVPQIFFHNTLIGGCAELQKLTATGRLPEALQRAMDGSPLMPELSSASPRASPPRDKPMRKPFGDIGNFLNGNGPKPMDKDFGREKEHRHHKGGEHKGGGGPQGGGRKFRPGGGGGGGPKPQRIQQGMPLPKQGGGGGGGPQMGMGRPQMGGMQMGGGGMGGGMPMGGMPRAGG
eukprot:NODE_931_length_1114_cov_46.909828_g888_i0.p1 GENE.NODE_931_length_1114_cov_46.909828_g888_i0~~NODE_931_length_1114_cov_46.909828_g888_i0.p1  ORF type:complete len:228 (-),score=55.72 NODE_931_length_1114_cov_46.909828_g888_i0:337-1020(-)